MAFEERVQYVRFQGRPCLTQGAQPQRFTREGVTSRRQIGERRAVRRLALPRRVAFRLDAVARTAHRRHQIVCRIRNDQM